ncbi:MAG: hypothetical protein ABIR32_16685, partial [Ilumatobacteraceae bacterium]
MERLSTDLEGRIRATTDDLGLDDVHRRRADELGDEQVVGRVVQILRRGALHQVAPTQYRNPITHRHRLDLVVGDVHGRDAQPPLEPT